MKTTFIAPVVQRQPVCREAVAVFFDSLTVPRPYVPVASLDVGWGPDVAPPTYERLIKLLTDRAAKLGANGILVGAGWRDIPRGVGPSLAILISGDSARVRQACEHR